VFWLWYNYGMYHGTWHPKLLFCTIIQLLSGMHIQVGIMMAHFNLACKMQLWLLRYWQTSHHYSLDQHWHRLPMASWWDVLWSCVRMITRWPNKRAKEAGRTVFHTTSYSGQRQQALSAGSGSRFDMLWSTVSDVSVRSPHIRSRLDVLENCNSPANVHIDVEYPWTSTVSRSHPLEKHVFFHICIRLIWFTPILENLKPIKMRVLG
jgi:hypothetical protein